jgi:hypothetical protein
MIPAGPGPETIHEQTELLRGFNAGTTIAPSKDTWHDLPASFRFRGGTRDEAEKMQPPNSRQAIRWYCDKWQETSRPLATNLPPARIQGVG